MPEAEVTVKLVCDISRVQELLTEIQARVEELGDQWRCPDVAKGEDLRCELDRDHGEDRHVHDRFSWPVTQDPPKAVAAGHFQCPSPGPFGTCEKSPHHHWRSPTGVDWIMSGSESACDRDHLADWARGKL